MGKAGAVGDPSGNFISISGALFDCVYNQTMIGITLEDLQKIPNPVAVAMGSKKNYASLDALRTGAIVNFIEIPLHTPFSSENSQVPSGDVEN